MMLEFPQEMLYLFSFHYLLKILNDEINKKIKNKIGVDWMLMNMNAIKHLHFIVQCASYELHMSIWL